MSSKLFRRCLYSCSRAHHIDRFCQSSVNAEYLSPVFWGSQGQARKLLHSSSLHSTVNIKRNEAVNEDRDDGSTVKREFQAETRMLLDIVAKSLYSEKEVFIRELISNASDALSKLRYVHASGKASMKADDLKIELQTEKSDNTLCFRDNGIGLTEQDMIENLGTIARSGSKAFLAQLEESGKGGIPDDIIGQFGVGFYSVFMVADKVEVYSKVHDSSQGYKWTSDGSAPSSFCVLLSFYLDDFSGGTYEITKAEDVEPGTKIVVHLKSSEASKFTDEKEIKNVINKYSTFVNYPIYLNGEQINTVKALWLMDSKDISAEMHDEFYKYIAHNSYDKPRYCLHYKTDAPIDIRALLYVPESKPNMHEMAINAEPGVSLYCRQVLIQTHATDILPKWARFLKGVIDSEDIPLNLSRELLQKSAVIVKLKETVVSKLLKFLKDQQKRDFNKYIKFYETQGVYIKEGILSEVDQVQKEELAKLMLFESSSHRPGVHVKLEDYCSRMQAGQRDIYYMCAPSRELAESSPYYEAIREKGLEVLFCYEPFDEIVLMQLRQFDRKNLTSTETMVRQDKSEESDTDKADSPHMLSKETKDELSKWIKETLGIKVADVKFSSKVTSYPCLITVEEMAAARQFLRFQRLEKTTNEQKFAILKPTLELNSSHPLIGRLSELRGSDPDLAALLLEQVYDNAMVAAGLLEDPREMVKKLNDLLTKLTEKPIETAS